MRSQVISFELDQLSLETDVAKEKLEDIEHSYLDITALLVGQKNMFEKAIMSSSLSQNDQSTLKFLLRQKMDVYPDVKEFLFVGKNREVISSSEDENFIQSIISYPAFVVPQQSTEQVIYHEELGMLIASVPVVYNDVYLGHFSVIFTLDRIQEFVSTIQAGTETRDVVIGVRRQDGDIQIISPLRFSEQFVEESIEHRIISRHHLQMPIVRAVRKQPGILFHAIDFRGEPVIAVADYMDSLGWGIVVKEDLSEIMSPMRPITLAFLLVIGIVLFFAMIISYIMASSVSAPLGLLARFVSKINEAHMTGQESVSTELPKELMAETGEIGVLVNAFVLAVHTLNKFNATLTYEVDRQTKTILQTTDVLEHKVSELEETKKVMVSLLEDMNEQQDDLEQNAEQLQKFKQALDNTTDGVLIANKDAITIYSNKAITDITGYPEEEVLGVVCGAAWGGLIDDDFYKDFWHTLAHDKKPFIGVIQNKHKDGHVFDAGVNITPVLDDAGDIQFYIEIVRDMTEQGEIDRAKSEFVSLASHQLRTPLSSINWYTEMLLDGDAGELSDEQKNYIREVSDSSRRMSNLVNSLLDVSRLELGNTPLDLEVVNVRELLVDIIKEHAPFIAAHNLTITKRIATTLPKIVSDAKLIRIILENILDNAIKYTDAGGSISVSATANESHKHIIIKVKDSGCGIPESQKDQVFTKLFRADNVKIKDTEGAGLGLYMTKIMIEALGGTISFVSSENKGTTFSIILPFKITSAKKNNK